MNLAYLTRHSSDVVVLRRENAQLRRENAALADDLAAVRRELAQARRENADLMDVAAAYAVTEETERLALRPSAWQVMSRWPHSYSGVLDVAAAHEVMQEHVACLTGECRVRRTAARVLQENHRMSPDSSRPALTD